MNIGDKIICIDSCGSESLEYEHEYTIVDINHYGNLGLKNEKEGRLLAHYYKPNRFQIAPIAPVVKVGQIWKYKGEQSLFMVVRGSNKYTLIDLLTGLQHYPWYSTLDQVFGGCAVLFDKVADNMDEFVAKQIQSAK